MHDKLVLQCDIIKSIQIDNLSGMSKIHLASIIAQTIDLLNDNDENNCFEKLIDEMNNIYFDYEKYFNPWEDFYASYSDSSVSFLTYINEKPNNYLSTDDIKVKILVLEDFVKCFNDYKNLKYFSTVKIEKIKKYLEQWKMAIHH